MAERRDYLHLNPFLSNAVPEAAFWEPDIEFADVAAIHGRESSRLQRELEQVARSDSHATRVLFVVGDPGSGKSHLFGRLRRQLSHGEVFAFAANPPTRPSAIESWLLERVVSGMCRRLGRRFTQLQGFLYALVLAGAAEAPGADLDRLHDYWHGVRRAGRRKFLQQLRGRLTEAGHWDRTLLRVLLDVLDTEMEDAAVAWLSGATNLSDEQLAVIDQGGPNERVLETLLGLGELARFAARPIVLVLDQLDQMTTAAHVAQFERILIALHDNSRGWFVIVGLTRETYRAWLNAVSRPFVDRFLTDLDAKVDRFQTDADAIIALDPIRPADRRAIVTTRLASTALMVRRGADAVADPLFPLSGADVEELVATGGDYPRSVINRARERYRGCCLGPEHVPAPPSLDEAAAHAFDEALAAWNAETSVVEPAPLADRLAELVEVVCAADGRSVAREVGALERLPRFRGTDTVLTIDGTAVRLLGHHVQQGRQFFDFLKHALGVPPPAVLVRDGTVAVSGPRTLERLQVFRADRVFLHLSRPHIAEAFALGAVLAAVREGNLDDLLGSRPVSRPDVVAALGRLERLRQHPVVTAVLQALSMASGRLPSERAVDAGPSAAPSTSPAPAPSEPAERTEGDLPAPGAAGRPGDRSVPGGASAGAIVSDAQVAEQVADILRRERWMVVERLGRRLSRTLGSHVGSSRLRQVLARPPLRHHLTCHPENILERADIHIVIWAGD